MGERRVPRGLWGKRRVATVAQARRFQREEEREVREDESDVWGPPVGLRKEQKKKERGGCGAGPVCWAG
jgi:hypothetical protein